MTLGWCCRECDKADVRGVPRPHLTAPRLDSPVVPEWESITHDPRTQRLAVEGGWLYVVTTDAGVTSCFVPDPHPAPRPRS